MNNNLKNLIELQKIDSRLLSIEELRGDLPVIVEKLSRNLDGIKKEFDENELRLKEISLDINKESHQIEDNSNKLNKLKDQLYLVISNKEYDALNFEIDHLKESIANSEDIIINLEEEKDNINGKNENFQIEIDDSTKALDQSNSELQATMLKTEKEEKELNQERLKVIDTIEDKFVATYDRLRNAKDGLGIINIHSNACGACYTQLPRQTVIEVKESVDVISCPNCSTYLFFDEELS